MSERNSLSYQHTGHALCVSSYHLQCEPTTSLISHKLFSVSVLLLVLDQVIDGVVHLHYGLGSAVGATSSGMFTSCRFAFLCENMLRCEVEPCDFNVLDDESEVKHINHSFMAWSTYRDDYTVRGICMMAGGNPLHTLFVACILVKTDWTRMYISNYEAEGFVFLVVSRRITKQVEPFWCPIDYTYTGTSPKGLDPHFTVWIQFYWNYRMMDRRALACLLCFFQCYVLYLTPLYVRKPLFDFKPEHGGKQGSGWCMLFLWPQSRPPPAPRHDLALNLVAPRWVNS